MVATAHLGRQQQSARTVVRALALLRHMAPDHASPDQSLRVNWGVIATNAVGVVLGIALTATVTGIVFLVYRLPSQQDQLIRGQTQISNELTGLTAELKRLQDNDRIQDGRLIRLESR